MKKTTGNKTLNMVYIALFAVVMAICSWIVIPMTVPFTLQTFGVFLAVLLLGGKRGTLAVVLYLLMGAVGLPVFSGFTGGVGVLLGYTGGYIAGFLLLALTMWFFEALFGKSACIRWISMVLGLVLCYAFGTIWYVRVYAHSVGEIGAAAVLSICVLPFVIPDIIKMMLAMAVRKRLAKAIRSS